MENNFNELKSEGFVVSDLKKQMGNARFFVARSCSTLENHRLTCKLMAVGREGGFEEKKFTRIEVDRHGTKKWYWGDKLHRLNGPAVELTNGSKAWWVEGQLHRVDGPAIVWANGSKAWWVEGKVHRVDGPAVEDENGRKDWYFEGKRHREDGPAIERTVGFNEWWVNGKRYFPDE